MNKIPIIYSDSYYVDIGDHVFPTSKYRILKESIEKDEFLKKKCEIIPPEEIEGKVIRMVHEDEYIDKLETGSLSDEEILTMEVPYSDTIVKASFMCCGGTVTTARYALERKAAVHLGGGFHHAFSDHGEGFCVLNDVAVGIKALLEEVKIERALVFDCDLHQGNGTAAIFAEEERVFTFSIHQENNYPFHKPKSDLDIGLRDYTSDKEYLKHLYDKVPKIISTFKPDLIMYLAGADPFKEDQLGNLSLTKEGLRERDNFVCLQARNFGVPIAITLAGGYAFNRDDTVDIHLGTVEECVKVFGGEEIEQGYRNIYSG